MTTKVEISVPVSAKYTVKVVEQNRNIDTVGTWIEGQTSSVAAGETVHFYVWDTRRVLIQEIESTK